MFSNKPVGYFSLLDLPSVSSWRNSVKVFMVCSAFAFGLIGTPRAVAQERTATIGGTLRDPLGNALVSTEVTVHLTNTLTKAEFTTPIMRTSEFTLSGVPGGTYDLEIPIPCCAYAPYRQKGIKVDAGTALKMEIQVGWNITLGTIGDDPVRLMNEMRAKAGKIDGPTPRLPNGKPDFSGMWAPLVQTGAGILSQSPSLKPWAAEIQKKILESAKGDLNLLNAAAFCMPQSAIQIGLPFHFKLVQTPTVLIHITEYQNPGWRQVFTDGRGHPQDWNPSWVGHSIGRWEGDTLIVESVGFNDTTPGVGVHSDKLRLVERFRRPDLGHLEVDIRVEDEEAYTAPFTYAVRAELVPQEEILEYVCPENNKDPMHFGGLGYKGGR